jgi:uncharacterized protein with HEPN domain
MRADAIIRRLRSDRRAASKLSKEFREQHPEVPWRDIIAMRNVLIHAYRHIDMAKVWTAVSHDVPELLAILEPLNSEPEDEPDVG